MTRKADRRERIRQRMGFAVKQSPLPGVGAQTVRDVLNAEARAPLKGGARGMPAASIFGDAHKQKELF